MVETKNCAQEIGFESDELIKLRLSIAKLETELEKFKQPPLVVCEVKKILNDKAIVKLPNQSTFLVNVIDSLKDKLNINDQVLAEQRSLTVIKKIESAKKYSPEAFLISKKPTIKWADIGGLWNEIRELKEAIELPLKKPKLFKTIGIEPPKGVLLYGPPGCGKTLLAKALANSTKTTFIELVGSELVHKYIGDGSKLVKELFMLAKENAPSIIFIDEIDAIAAHRTDAGALAEREVQRTFMQLLAEIDGFKNLDNVKIIGATNRFDILDPALVRPGRLDRLIEINHPGPKARLEILNIYTQGMNLKKVSMKHLIELTVGFSGADLRLLCTEAGYFAIRDKRDYVTEKDFLLSVEKVKTEEEQNGEYINMFG